jgi:hypothetical protein
MHRGRVCSGRKVQVRDPPIKDVRGRTKSLVFSDRGTEAQCGTTAHGGRLVPNTSSST